MKFKRIDFAAALTASLVLLSAAPLSARAGITGYTAAPSDYDATLAIQARVEEASAASYFAGAGAPIYARDNYPIDVQLFRCEQNPDRLLPTGNGYSHSVSGYECVVSIFPAREPAYRVGGFFYFDGLSWRYYGPLMAPEIIEVDTFGKSFEAGVVRPKPGAITYDGFAGLTQENDPENSIFIAPAIARTRR